MTDQADARTLGFEVRYRRSVRGFTQQDVADELGVDHTYLSKVENDRQRPGYELVERLAALLSPTDRWAACTLHILAGHLPEGFEDRVRADQKFAMDVWALWMSSQRRGERDA